MSTVCGVTLLGKHASLISRVAEGIAGAVKPAPRPSGAARPVALLGHRGDTERAPENTVAACQAALVRGAHGVEVDLCVTLDGQVVLWHDRDPDDPIALARQGAAEGLEFVPFAPDVGSPLRRPISELAFAEFHASFGYQRRGDAVRDLLGAEETRAARPDRLDQLLGWAAREAEQPTLILDVKLIESELSLVPALLSALAVERARYSHVDPRRWILISANLECYRALDAALRAQRELDLQLVPDFELGGAVDVARELGARAVSIGATPLRLWPAVRDDIASAIEARDRGELDSVMVWGADDEQLREALELGVDLAIVKDIRAARALLNELRGSHEG